MNSKEDPYPVSEPVPHPEFHCSSGNASFPWESRLRPLAMKVLESEGISDSVNIVLCEDAEVRDLNKQYRKLDKVTDVLSFVWDDPGFLGEIYIARDQVKRQAPEYGNSYYQELKRVLVHGLLHLCGYDHIKVKDRKVMRAREQDFLGVDPYG